MRLRTELLEDRAAPAIDVVFDYSLDVNDFFDSNERRATLQAAVGALTSRLDDTLTAIPAPTSAFDTWSARYSNPGTGADAEVQNLVVPADTLIVFVGGRAIPGSTIGFAQAGFSVRGSTDWVNLIGSRGQAGALAATATDVGPWGGSITFDTGANWYNGTDLANIPSGKVSLFLTAQHEFGHLLGIGASDAWSALIDFEDATFTGPNAGAANGGPVPLQDEGHFRNGLTSGGQPVVMTAVQDTGGANGTGFTPLDFAALADIGWRVGAASVPPVTPPVTPPVVPVTPPPPPPPLPSSGQPFLVGNGDGGDNRVQYRAANATLGSTVTTFGSDVTGGVRVASGDVDGDGTLDTILGAGPGGEPEVRVILSNGTELYRFNAFESSFTGGIYVASGDFDGDGKADIVVTPDEGGGPRVRVISSTNGTRVIADFFGIDDTNFRGGARAAVGDLNNDTTPDVLVGAGFGGGPRLAGFDGATLGGQREKLFDDFFVFEDTLRNGIFLAAGDTDGDAYAEVVAGGGPGGGPRVLVLDGFDMVRAQRRTVVANFFAGDSSNRGGVRVAARDLDGDRRADIVTGSGPVTESRSTVPGTQVTTYLSTSLTPTGSPPFQNQFEAFPGGRGGVFVG